MLAIVNENAGLMEDLLLMAERGKPLSHERLQRIAAVLKKQVNRGDGIVKAMNRFSHSIDLPKEKADVYEATAFVVSLWNRKIAEKGVSVDVIPPVEPLTITTHLFGLEHLFWRCLEWLLQRTEAGSSIQISMAAVEDGACIDLTAPDAVQQTEPSFPGDRISLLSAFLSATIDSEIESGRIQIRLPDRI